MANLMSSDFVIVNVSNSGNDNLALDIKLPKSLSVAQLKLKLEIITGGCASSMQLQLYKSDSLFASLTDDEALIGSLITSDHMRIHVIDNFSLLTDNNVPKFELTDDQYERKDDSVRNFLKKNRLGKYNETAEQREEERKKVEQERAEACVVGARCRVTVSGNPRRIGTIMYNGPLDGKDGTFIGVKYDEPLGKNDGSLKGKSYFTCPPNYGGFVLPTAVEVGNFEEEAFLDDEL